MSQNGPHGGQSWPASGDGPDRPYSEPADPWGEYAPPTPTPAWSDNPQSVPPSTGMSPGWTAATEPAPGWTPAAEHAPGWTPAAEPAVPPAPPPLPPRRNAPIVALVLALGILIAVGIGVAGWLLSDKNRTKAADQTPSQAVTSTVAASQAAQHGTGDGFAVAAGECVGVTQAATKKEQPTLHKAVCASGTFKVLKRIDGKTTGSADAIRKCNEQAKGYDNYFFYDSALDSLDYVLCLGKN
jgi:hypothetical protein